MRIPRVRFTVRGMMVIVLGLAIVLHLTVTAWLVHRSGHQHIHSYIVDSAYGPGWAVVVRKQPFWPTFWRRSTGITGWDRKICLTGDAELMEMCELANPEIRMSGPMIDPNTFFAAVHTSEQIELAEKMRKARYPSRPVGTITPATEGLSKRKIVRMIKTAALISCKMLGLGDLFRCKLLHEFLRASEA